jgi:uncharacterized protein YceH (UPF0502 family)
MPGQAHHDPTTACRAKAERAVRCARVADVAAIEELLHRRSDLSTFVVHFTRDSGRASARENLEAILYSQTIEARTVYGMAKNLAAKILMSLIRSVRCVSPKPRSNTRG